MTCIAAPRAVSGARPRHRLAGASLLVLLFALAGCGGSADDTRDAEMNGRPAGMQTEPAAAGDSADRLEFRISSGAFAGTHEAAGDMGCFAQQGLWGANLSRPGDPGMSEILLMVQGVPDTGGSSDQVDLTVSFGDVMTDETGESSGMVGIGAVSGGGSGTATVTRDGRAAVIEVVGTSNHGSAITAVFRCANVQVVR